ncbi:MAG: sensor histidine kinase [Candidatus Brocadiia bacterium]
MKRLWHAWVPFALGLAVVLAVMGWMTATALRLRRQARLEEAVRLALWRMDSAVSPLIARENARPYFVYTAYYAAERAYNRMFQEFRPNEVLLPSPLLTLESGLIRLHFQLGPDGQLTSPQAPTGNMRDRAQYDYRNVQVGGVPVPERIERADVLLAELQEVLRREELLRALEEAERRSPPPGGDGEQAAGGEGLGEPLARPRAAQQGGRPSRAAQRAALSRQASAVSEGVLRPLWADGHLVLARRVEVKGEEYVQGCWLSWEAIAERLRQKVRDLLPEARLEPVPDGPGRPQGRMLAMLPVRLVPGTLPRQPVSLASPMHLSLLVAWGCVVLAAVAVGVVLFGALRLSERRAAFVSAVTHELRTPITTLQMYSEMLAEGMVEDEARRARYLETLRAESDRLGHLIDNVLAFARLERGRGRRQVQAFQVDAVVERAGERLGQRARQGGMRLVTETQEEAAGLWVEVDISALEQILLNLVDNACKYASRAEDKRIHLVASAADGSVVLRVRDHGPGIEPGELPHLFRAFSKSARDAAHSAPGVGLGLALSRRLARDMGGDLRLEPSVEDGACFLLTLPAAEAPAAEA